MQNYPVGIKLTKDHIAQLRLEIDFFFNLNPLTKNGQNDKGFTEFLPINSGGCMWQNMLLW